MDTHTHTCSLTDHPLAKLLGEGQYNVYMMLQPVVLAIERAGGLPHLEIRLDNCGLDRKPSEGGYGQPYIFSGCGQLSRGVWF